MFTFRSTKMAWEALRITYNRFEGVLKFFSVYSKLGAAKNALEEGHFWIDEVDDDMDQLSLDEIELEQGAFDSDECLSETDDASQDNAYSSILEFDDIDDYE